MAKIFFGIGSNINPRENIFLALNEIKSKFTKIKISPVYQNKSAGFEGEDFLNLVVSCTTEMDVYEVNWYQKTIQVYGYWSTRLFWPPPTTTATQNTTSKGYAIVVKYIESVADHATKVHCPEVKLQEYAFVGGKIWGEDLRKNLEPGNI